MNIKKSTLFVFVLVVSFRATAGINYGCNPCYLTTDYTRFLYNVSSNNRWATINYRSGHCTLKVGTGTQIGFMANVYTCSVYPNAYTAISTSINMQGKRKLIDADNTAITGNASYTLAYFNPTEEKAWDSFSGNFIDKKSAFFNIYNRIDLYMADDTVVDLAKPCRLQWLQPPKKNKIAMGNPYSRGSLCGLQLR